MAMTPVNNRIDRLEALAETVLLAIDNLRQRQEADQEKAQEERQIHRQELHQSIEDVVGMIGTLAEQIGEVNQRVDVSIAQAAADRQQAAIDRTTFERQAEADRAESRQRMEAFEKRAEADRAESRQRMETFEKRAEADRAESRQRM